MTFAFELRDEYGLLHPFMKSSEHSWGTGRAGAEPYSRNVYDSVSLDCFNRNKRPDTWFQILKSPNFPSRGTLQ